jgi:glyoxylase-like metal-dependent hydrolase (beta-lactamase superfamily II)
MPVLMESIFQVLIPLGDETRILPGHGPATTIGEERVSNPFLTDRG